MKASIIVLAFNQVEETTKPCLESILKYTDLKQHELIIVDNASSDTTPNYLTDFGKQHPEVKIILNQENYGYARGNNIGIEASSGDYVVLLNNDTAVTKNWIEKLIAHFNRGAQNWGLISPVSNSVGNEQKITIKELNMDNYSEVSKIYTQMHQNVIFETDMIGFFCVMIPRKIIDSLGVLDQKFGIGMFEDTDYCMRVMQAGYKLGIAEDCFIYHSGSVSFKKFEEEKYQEIFRANKAYYNQKHAVEQN